MSPAPLVSVLMPVYNAEHYVSQAVESILNQTFGHFEFLIVDDGSTDASHSILKQYAAKDDRIRLISRPNTGYVIALNEMLHLAQGEFIARMDADDIALPERFQLQVNLLHHEPDVVCVGGTHGLIDAKGRFLTTLAMPEHNDEIQRLAIAGHTTINHPSAMMRRTAVLQVGGYDPLMAPCEDLDLWLRLGEIGQLRNVKETVLLYRLHANSVSERTQTLQRQKAKEACERAWHRRGIQGTFEATTPWRPTADRRSQHQFMLQYGWWAFNSRQRQTAAIYATKAIRALPWKTDGWTLLACALVKPLPPSPKSPTNHD